MSVKKYVINRKDGNFTTIPNKVLQGLKNYEALGLYCYIASLPQGWEFHKTQLSDHANIGRDKLNKALKILEVCGLITITQLRTANGQFANFVMEVDDGNNFDINYLDKLSTQAAPFTEKPLTENRLLVTSSYKGNTYKSNNNKNERESTRKKRAPLPDPFFPNPTTIQMLESTARKVSLTPQELVTKFRNLQKLKNKQSSDWDAELQNFLINERPALKKSNTDQVGTGFASVESQSNSFRRLN